MNSFLNSKIGALCGLVLVVVVLILTFSLRFSWWSFIDIFFFFMAAFAHLSATLFVRMNPYASRALDTCAFWMLVIGVVALLAEFVAWQIIV